MLRPTTNAAENVSIGAVTTISDTLDLPLRLIVHVSEFRSDVQPIDETVWHSVASIMPDLRVAVHMLNAHETFRKYSRLLRPGMPLSHLR